MDTMQDSGHFRTLLDQLCAVWDRPPAKDEQVKAYWHALRDVKFSEVRANAERIMRSAGGKRPFPKPAELRDEAPSEAGGSDGAFKAGEDRAHRNLEELRRRDEPAWKREVQMRKLDRMLVTEHEGSPIYAQALEEWRRLRGLNPSP